LSRFTRAVLASLPPQARSTGKDNHGLQWGKAAVEMALLRISAVGGKSKKFFMGFGDSGDPVSCSGPHCRGR